MNSSCTLILIFPNLSALTTLNAMFMSSEYLLSCLPNPSIVSNPHLACNPFNNSISIIYFAPACRLHVIHFGADTQSHTVQPTALQEPWSPGHQEPTGLPGILPRKSRVFTGSDDQQLCRLLLNLSHKCWCLTKERSRTRQLGTGKEAELFEPLTRLFQGFSLEHSASFHFSLLCCMLNLLGVTDSWKWQLGYLKCFETGF